MSKVSLLISVQKENMHPETKCWQAGIMRFAFNKTIGSLSLFLKAGSALQLWFQQNFWIPAKNNLLQMKNTDLDFSEINNCIFKWWSDNSAFWQVI